jgi:hypothetical protein
MGAVRFDPIVFDPRSSFHGFFDSPHPTEPKPTEPKLNVHQTIALYGGLTRNFRDFPDFAVLGVGTV